MFELGKNCDVLNTFLHNSSDHLVIASSCGTKTTQKKN